MKRIWYLLAAVMLLGALAGSAGAAEQLIPGKLFVAAAGGKLVKVLSNGTFTLPTGDPTVDGGSLHVFDEGPGPTGGDDTYNLSSGQWSPLGSPPKGWRYKGAGTAPDPCKVVLITPNLIKAVCKGPGVSLTPPFAGPAGVVLAVSTDNYCAEFTDSTCTQIKNDTHLVLRREPCPAPNALAACTATSHRPNIVVILTDDQRFDTIGNTHSLDGVTPVMPHVTDALANQGITFTNTYATTPVCTPSRTSILTGLYAHHTGVYTNYVIPDSLQTNALPTWLHAHGYRTGFFGKYPQVQNVVPAPPGWDEWQAFDVIGSFNYSLTNNGSPVSYGSTAAEYATDVLAGKTVQFIQSTPLNQPVFCILATYAPHSEGTSFPVPAPRHVGMFANVSSWRPPSYSEPDLSDKPVWMGALHLASDPFASGFFTYGSWTDLFRKNQLEALQAVDEAVGSIVAAIEARGQSNDTAIIYTSDNGLLWGEHRLYFTKGPPYAESARVPLIIRYPKLASGPQVASQIALNIDLAATIADITGLQPPYALDGQSLVPVIMDPMGASRRTDFLYESPQPTAYNSVGIRTEDEWEYNEYETGEEELYDLMHDPNELGSVAGDPANQTLKSTLAARIRQLQQ